MAGGPKVAYDLVAPILTKVVAQVEHTGPCCGYLGPIGAGNYVKMVHNGIEYCDMQVCLTMVSSCSLRYIYPLLPMHHRRFILT